MLTTLESGLLVALGALMTWLVGLSSSRTQWRREERRRQTDRRSALYEEMLAEVESRSRDQAVLRGEGVVGEPVTHQDRDFVDREARFNARVMLFASYEVNGLWHEWDDAFSASWGSLEDGVQGAAARALAAAMRTELDSP